MSDTIISTALEGDGLVVETRDGSLVYDAKFIVAAMLVFIAKGSGDIEPEESAKMIDMIEEHFHLQGAESLELLTRAISEFSERADFGEALAHHARNLPDSEKEEIALMCLKVIAADGRREVAEMEQFSAAIEAAEIAPEIVHRAYDRYFAETMPGS